MAIQPKKLMINLSMMQDEFFSDAHLVGIASGLASHRLCWMLSNCLDVEFCRRADLDICVKNSKKEDQHYPVYEFTAPHNGSRHLLYQLRSEKDHLLPEVKALNFLWMIQGERAEDEVRSYCEYLRQITEVQMAVVIPISRIKHVNYLMV